MNPNIHRRARRLAGAWLGGCLAALTIGLATLAGLVGPDRHDHALPLSEPKSASACSETHTGHGDDLHVHSDADGVVYGEVAWPNGKPRLSVCFAPGTKPAYVEAFMRTMMAQENGAWPPPGQQDYNVNNSWSATPATPRQLSWSLVPDGTTIPSYGLGAQAGSNLFATLDSQFSSQGGRNTWIKYFTNVFARWNEISGLSYRRIMYQGQPWDDGANFDTASGSTARGDVRISSRALDGSSGVLAFNFYPSTGSGGNMVIDSSESWGGSTGNLHRFLRNVLSHEHGHGIGIAHVCPAIGQKLMEPFLATGFDGPQHDDNRAAVYNYGDRYEPNSTAATASPLGTVIQGLALTTADDAPAPLAGAAVANLSTMALETNGQVDWYKFSINGAATVAISVIPVGFSYDDMPQGSSCPSGNTINSAAIANLDVELYSGGGTTLVIAANSQPAGSTETLSQALASAGEYHIRVLEGGTAIPSQLYRLEISVNGGSSTNTAPTAVADTYTVLEDNALAVDRPGVLSNDTDPQGQRLVAALITSVPAAQGILNFSTQGSFDFVPAQDFNGSTSFTYRANDGALNSSSPTVTLNVTPVNDRPSFVSGGNVTVNEDAGPVAQAWATSVSPGPADEAGQTLTFTVTNNNNALFSAQPAIAPNGTLSFTPTTNANGAATVTVTLADNGGTANGGLNSTTAITFTLTVNAVNDAPSFTAGPNQTVNEDSGARTVTGWATNISRGPSNEASQTVAFVVTNDNNALFSGQPAVGSSGTLSFTPAANRFGTATVSVRAQDNGGTANGGVDQSPVQTFTITVSPVNDAPSFTNGTNQTVNEDSGPRSAPGWATNITAGPFETQGLLFEITSNSNPSLFAGGPSIAGDGTLFFTPAPDAFGAATIQYRLRDDGGVANGGVDVSSTASFTITVDPVNDAPTFVDGPDQTVNEDSGLRTVPGWATNLSTGPANESGQVLSFEIVSIDNPALFAIVPAVSSAGQLTFAPATHAFGSAAIQMRARDNGGTANGGVDFSPTRTFVITVLPVNDAPVFTAGANPTVNEDSGPATINPWATAIQPGPPNETGQLVTFEIVSNSNPSLFSAGPAVAPNGALTFTPAPDQNGSAIVQVRLRDDGGTANGGVDTSAPQTFTIFVTSVNDAPVLQPIGDQTATVGQALNFGAIASDPGDVPPNALTFSLDAGAPSGATIDSATGAFDWTPSAGQVGPHTVTIRVTDNGTPNLSDFETITITVDAGTRSVAGTVGLQGWTASLSDPLITLELRDPGSSTALQTEVLNLTAAGEFSFVTALPPGSYDLTAKGGRWLRAKLANITLGASGASGLSVGDLIPGDIVESNVVDLDDFLALASTYEQSPPSVPEADLTGDGLVNLDDFLLLAAAYEVSGAP